GAGIGVVVLALFVTLGVIMFGGGDEEGPGDETENAADEKPKFETEKYTDPDGRFTVEIPNGWNPVPNGENTFVDGTDHDDKDRWLRLRVVPSEGDPKAVLENAVSNGIAPTFEKGSIEQKALEADKLGGLGGQRLEYTGTRNDGQQRHAMWLIGSDGST